MSLLSFFIRHRVWSFTVIHNPTTIARIISKMNIINPDGPMMFHGIK